MFNVDSRLHRSPYEELQSINLDGTIVGLKYPTNHWNWLWADYSWGRLFSFDLFSKASMKDSELDGIRDVALHFPEDFDLGLVGSFGYLLSSYIIERPECSWNDVYDYMQYLIKAWSYWTNDDETEGYLLLAVSPLSSVMGGEMETFPSKENPNLYVSDALSFRHYMFIHWDSFNLLEMTTAINKNGYTYISFHIGDSYFGGRASVEYTDKAYFVGGEWLNLLSMVKPVKAGMLNRGDGISAKPKGGYVQELEEMKRRESDASE